MSNVNGNKTRPQFPQERSSRRPGWNKGPGLKLAGGGIWHLPRVDDALIPLLPGLVGIAESFHREFVAYLYRGGSKPIDFESRLLSLVSTLLRSQYRNREVTFRALILAAEGASLIELLDVIDRYLHDLQVFASGRLPIMPGIAHLAAWN